VEAGITVLAAEEDEGPVDRYILSKRLAIGRRTGISFLRGIVDKTLFTSALYLREHFELPILIVEGQVDFQYTSFNPRAVRGALSSMVLFYGLSVLSTPDTMETVRLIAMMARQEQIGIPEISLVPKRKAEDLPDMQRRIVEMLPGCGRAMARDLLQHFGTIKRIANATKAECRRGRGIGAKKAAQVHKVLNAEYEAVDTEKDLEDAIEAAPGLLFEQPVTLLARQHQIYTEGGDRHVVDLVFLDPATDELILVELKRGRLTAEHSAQIRRYLDNAPRSNLLQGYLERGSRIRGVLATVEECDFKPPAQDVSKCIIDRDQAIRVLKRLRTQRLAS